MEKPAEKKTEEDLPVESPTAKLHPKITKKISSFKIGQLDQLKKEVEEQDEERGIEWLDELKPELFFPIWEDLIERSKTERAYLHAALQNTDIDIKGGTVHIVLASKIAGGQLQDLMNDMMSRFKIETRFRKIEFDISAKAIEHEDTGKPYSDIEIYNHFIEQNPALEEMRKRLGLDIE